MDGSGAGAGEGSGEGERGGLSLPDLFQRGQDAQKRIESGEMTSNSDEYKSCVSTGIRYLEEASQRAGQLALFSRNEHLEEVATADLKYLLVPALLGDLTLQVTEGSRIDALRRARAHLTEYLDWCHCYGIASEPLPGHSAEAMSVAPISRNLEAMAVDRNAKIAKLREQKRMEKKLQELAARLESSGSAVDEELVREHLLVLLQTWVLKCEDHVRGVDREMELLEGMEQLKSRGKEGGARNPSGHSPSHQQPRRLPAEPPFVITKEMLQRTVFGAGYPSVPTMSLEQFYDQRYREQLEAQQRQVSQPKKEEEEEEEEESEESLRKAREFDEYKDDHRRGTGNRKNMG